MTPAAKRRRWEQNEISGSTAVNKNFASARWDRVMPVRPLPGLFRSARGCCSWQMQTLINRFAIAGLNNQIKIAAAQK
jgi:hypothetical protein